MLYYGLIATICPTVTTEEEFYAPGIGQTAIGLVTICNVTSIIQKASLAVTFHPGAAGIEEWKFKDKNVPANDGFQIPIALTNDQTIRVRTSNAANSISFTFDGQLKTITVP